VASENDDNEDRIEAPHEPRECMACRATGRVISNLGASPSSVACPWCGGSGLRAPGIDAQARWVEHDAGEEAHEESGAQAPGDSPDSAA
jgi:hypothetical protein